VTTLAFWQSGQALRLLGGPIPIHCPVRLLQGQEDRDVPWQTALRISQRLNSYDVQTLLVKDGDHRLSRDSDITLIIDTLGSLLDIL
jgi:pimeloyl-ACP methyl ester carboxylesterase